ncbi:FAD-dependent oxidoreductase [Clostridium sp. SYSU_GA19001]|uniref:NAD(P)/FAD-dependent oxidoreductase n=1 Tax=Clostridium caldaquaticum TaxID=2940653 RepID=UPI002077574B|nr:FAD-dependent oxidoreductase [Clostridium caldaquaticum]MCM8711350.1 FAD-dependent oxidoreductase [Clostridium caldaquaticum]
MDYDILILGGGIIGCAAAYELSKYSLNIAVIEKDYDIADDVALINSAVVYDGIECSDSLVSKLEVMGNNMFDEITSKFKVPFKRTGGLIIAGNKKEEQKIIKMYDRAVKRGIQNIKLLDSSEVYKMEPNLNIKVEKALHSENIGVVCPYDLALAYAEVAFDNGVNFKLEEEVIDIQRISKGFKVETNKNKFTCKMVINTAPVKKYSIDENYEDIVNNVFYLKYFLLEKDFKGIFKNTLFTISSEGEREFTIPSMQGNTIAALNTKENLSYNESIKKISAIINGVKDENITSFYQSMFYKNNVLIDDSSVDKGYIKISAKHYGEVTMTPSIAKIICETVVSNMKCRLKKDFHDKRREFYKFRELSNKERDEIIKLDKRYAKIVCLCEMITEGEIIEAIRRPLGARTLEGVKRRTGTTLGSCQGAYCTSKIVSILARETNKQITEIVKDSKNSRIVLNRIKEFDGV